ncbi:MAG: tyrosine recombinase XerC [Betaproteobacteria bacterium]|nr:tyrosine recombinase XerC [Betaproteobacteria bacterium]
MDNLHWIERWLDHLAAERGLSGHTLNHYRRDALLLDHHSRDTPFDTLHDHDLRRILASLHQQGLSGRSLARMLSAWRNLFRFLMRRHGFPRNPCDGLRPPRHPQPLPHSLSVDQTFALLEPAPRADDPLATRDQAMFELLYSCGLRLSELARLTLTQLDLAQGELRVIGKGNKTRIVPIGRVALEALARWLAVRGSQSGDWLFPGRNPQRPITGRAIELRLARRAVLAASGQPVHPHMLRHAFASHLLQSSGDLRAVQELLGHARISSTQIYTRLDFQHLARVYDQAHPRARKKPAP